MVSLLPYSVSLSAVFRVFRNPRFSCLFCGCASVTSCGRIGAVPPTESRKESVESNLRKGVRGHIFTPLVAKHSAKRASRKPNLFQNIAKAGPFQGLLPQDSRLSLFVSENSSSIQNGRGHTKMTSTYFVSSSAW